MCEEKLCLLKACFMHIKFSLSHASMVKERKSRAAGGRRNKLQSFWALWEYLKTVSELIYQLWSIGYNHALPTGLRMFCKLEELFETMGHEHFSIRFLKNAWSQLWNFTAPSSVCLLFPKKPQKCQCSTIWAKLNRSKSKHIPALPAGLITSAAIWEKLNLSLTQELQGGSGSSSHIRKLVSPWTSP